MRKIALIAFAASFGLVGAASAADMAAKPIYTKATPIAPVWSWTGSYIGGYVGGAWADPSTSVPVNNANVPLFAGGPSSYNLNASFIGGYTGGYNWQFAPNWLIGYEGETGYMKLKGTGGYAGAPTVFATTESGSLYSVWAARFGYVSDKSLIYVKGGAALAQFETTVFNTPGTLFVTNKKYELTYAVGGGWEYAFDPKWSVKAEYLYLGFDNNSLGAIGISNGIRGAVFQENVSTVLPGIHTVKVGLNYKWDWFGILR